LFFIKKFSFTVFSVKLVGFLSLETSDKFFPEQLRVNLQQVLFLTGYKNNFSG